MNNYEKENAAEWQTVGPRRGRRPKAQGQEDAVTGAQAKKATDLSQTSPRPLRSLHNQPPPQLRGRSLHTMPPRGRRIPRGAEAISQAPQLTTSAPLSFIPHKMRSQGNQKIQEYSCNVSAGLSKAKGSQGYIFAAGKRDNTAKSRFRSGGRPDEFFVLSKHCHRLEPDLERLYTMLEEMGVRLGSYIRPPQYSADTRLLIWGDAEAVRSTKQELETWQAAVGNGEVGFHERSAKGKQHGEHGIGADGGITSLNKRMKENAKRIQYQRAPPEGLKFRHNGMFIWPIDEVRPDDLLGLSLEAYDPIRQAAEAHVIFDSPLSCFRIMSNEDSALAYVMRYIVGTMREYVARTTPRITVKFPVFPSEMREDVYLSSLPNSGETQSEVEPSIPTLSGQWLSGQSLADFKELKACQAEKTLKTTLAVFRKVIDRLQYYRGSIKMRVEFGIFSLQNWFRWAGAPTPYTEFLEMLGLERTRGTLLRTLGFPLGMKAENVISEGASYDSLLEPLGSHEPDWSARYICNTKSGRVALEVGLNKAADSRYHSTTRSVWLDMERTDAERPMEQYFVNFTGGPSARFSINVDNILDPSRISPLMADFASSIRCRAPAAGQPEGARVFSHKGVLNVEQMQQKMSYRSRIANNPTWVLELARYDSFGSTASTMTNSYWSAALWNTEWDIILANNATTTIGEGASWKPTTDTFFPNTTFDSQDPDVGFRDFYHNIERSIGFLESVKAKNPGHAVDPIVESGLLKL